MNKQERRAIRRRLLMAAFDKLLAMTIETRDNDWLWQAMKFGGPFDVASWKEFEHDDEMRAKCDAASAHYEMLTADWPNVSAHGVPSPTASTDDGMR